jgi:Zn ribbon nucleic-acid-binding protein
MAKKRIAKIPKTATIKCPLCGKGNRLAVSANDNVYFHECRKCKQRIETPQSKCCLVCAFSKTKCPASLLREAQMKGLEIRY